MPGYEWLGEAEKEQVNDVLDTGILFRYEFNADRKGIYKVREFEEKFAQYTGAVYAQAVTSGTAALRVALGRARGPSRRRSHYAGIYVHSHLRGHY